MALIQKCHQIEFKKYLQFYLKYFFSGQMLTLYLFLFLRNIYSLICLLRYLVSKMYYYYYYYYLVTLLTREHFCPPFKQNGLK